MWLLFGVLIFVTFVDGLVIRPPSQLKLTDIGVSNYSCDPVLMKRSKTRPTNVNSLRPADIDVVMSIGDSLTAANGAGAEDPVAVILQYRGLAFEAGGDNSLEIHATIPNILKKYNPKLSGYSEGIGSAIVWEVAKFNVAFPGANAKDLPGQARQLVSLLHAHPEAVNMKEDWKLLNIFIGGNDACGYCRHESYNPAECVANISQAIQIIYDNVPRVMVSLTGMLHLEVLRQTDKGELFCQRLHKDECGCESNKEFTDQMLSDYCVQYADNETALAVSGIFDKDDFTLVNQPFFRNVVTPPQNTDGTINHAFFAPDCFHFSQYGHALVTTWLWKNMLEPVQTKTTSGSLSQPAIPLACPDPNCPFFRTNANSKDCSKYMTLAA